MPKLTKRFVENINPDPEKTLKFWDSELKGFGMVVLPSGRRTYCIQYRNQDRIIKRLKIGVHGTITTEQARSLAKKRLGEVAHGEDPTEEKKRLNILPTMEELALNYIERHGHKKKLNSLKGDQGLLKNVILPALGRLKVAHITRQDIESIHKNFQSNPYKANHSLRLLSTMFNLAIQWGWRSDNPVKGIKKYQEFKRYRWLNDEEMQTLFSALESYRNQNVVNAIRLLVLTGARKNEALGAKWEQFDLEKGVWTKPAHRTKEKKMAHIPLSTQAISFLKKIKEKSITPHLFPGKIDGKSLQDIKKGWKTIITRAGLTEVRIHDLRHTFASHLVSSGLSLTIVGKLLGHTQISTTQRYAHLADEPLRQAAEFFGSKVEKLTSKTTSE